MDSKKFLELYKKNGAARGGRGRPWAGATGLYMVAPSCPANFYDGETCENPVPKHVKIGRASGQGGLGSRIASYSSYWPHGTTVHAVMITPSYDKKYGIIRDYASARETTLKRVLRKVDALGFGSNGKGGQNGSEKVVSSEWVRMQPSELIRYFDAVGPKRHPGDRLYTCNSNQCLQVPRDMAPKRRQTRVSRASSSMEGTNWKALEAVLKNESELGIPGRPVVLTKAARSAAVQPDHPFHKWAVQLVTNKTKQNQLAQRRLKDRAEARRKKADNEHKQKMRGVLSRAATRRLEREYKKYKRKNPLPRDLAAVQNTVAFRYAPKQLGIPTRARAPRVSRTKPDGGGVERARSSSEVKVKDKLAIDTFGVHLRAATSDSSPISAPSLGGPYQNQRTHYDRARSTARKRVHWPMDNERLPLKLENAIYDRTLNGGEFPHNPARTRQNKAKRAPKKAPVQAVRACPLLNHSVIKQYLGYTHHDVAGDGRCYFYVILKALGMKLTGARGAECNLVPFFENNTYFNPRNKRKLQRQVRKGTFGNPEMIVHYSPAIRKLLWDRKIRYIATIQKTKKKLNVVDDYMQDPLRHLVQLSELHGPSTSFRLQTLTAKQYPSQKEAFMHATAKKQVITFVHQNFPVGSEHFTVIIPRRVRTFPCLD